MRPHLATLVDDFRRHGKQTAIVTYRGVRRAETSYEELARLSERFAAELAHRGIERGERVILWSENRAEWVAAFFGCVMRGVLVVPLDAAGTRDFAERVIADTRPRLILGASELISQLGEVVPLLALDSVRAMPAAVDQRLDPAPLTPDTPLQILFTSGTTATPKGVVHTHRNVLASLEPIEREMQKYLRYERLVHPLRILHTLPLSHVFGQFMGLWIPALMAAEVHFESRLQAPRLLETIHRERVSVLAAVPRVLELMKAHLLNENPELAKEIQASSGERAARRWWRFRKVHRLLGWKFWALVCGGASLPAELEEFWSALGFALIQGYGMTETAALITLNHPFKIGKGTIGKPLPGREIRIRDDGEILVRGEMVASAMWRNGAIERRDDPWLATGDLVTQDDQGQLRFLGRKSEVIVTASGLNIHPEDLEAALARQPGVKECAVVGVGGEALAVLVSRKATAANAVRAANTALAEFQQIRRWLLWPEPTLPRTSTGKVKRRDVAGWAAVQASAQEAGSTANGPHTEADLLLAMIASVTRSETGPVSEDARLSEDLHLDSLGRVQLQSELEKTLSATIEDEAFSAVETLGQLRQLTGLYRQEQTEECKVSTQASALPQAGHSARPSAVANARQEFVYPEWPWWPPVRAARVAFQEAVMRPLVGLLANPILEPGPAFHPTGEPLILIANHVTSYDVPLVLYALLGRMRRRVVIAMSGEMLEDWRHGRNQGSLWLNLLGPAQYWLVTALFHVFPLPRMAGFRQSFRYVGSALDRGAIVLIFPEGHRSEDGKLQAFRPGIGLLARECGARILPVALKGLGEFKLRRTRWFRSGRLKIRVGQPLTVDTTASTEEIVERLHGAIKGLLDG